MDIGTKCFDCGGELVMRPNTHVESVGQVKVTDSTGFAPTCQDCGNVFLPGTQLQQYELRAAALVLRDGQHVNGSVVRYARHALGMRQVDLAQVLGHASETISRWENGESVSRRDQLALAGLLDGVREGEFTTEGLLNPPEPRAEVAEPELEVPRSPAQLPRCA